MEREGGEWELVWVALCEEGSEQALWACKAEAVQGKWGVRGGRICKVEGAQGRWGVQDGRICKAEGVQGGWDM